MLTRISRGATVTLLCTLASTTACATHTIESHFLPAAARAPLPLRPEFDTDEARRRYGNPATRQVRELNRLLLDAFEGAEPRLGYAVLRVTSVDQSFNPIWMVPLLGTLTVSAFLGIPYISHSTEIALEIEVQDATRAPLNTYTASAKGKAYGAMYWGYVTGDPGHGHIFRPDDALYVTRAAHASAGSQALASLLERISSDRTELLSRLQATGTIADAAWEVALAEGTAEAFRAAGAEHPSLAAAADSALEELAWRTFEGDSTSASAAAYLERFPTGRYADRARTLVDELTWREAARASGVEPVVAYLERFPQGRHATDAAALLPRRRYEVARATGTMEALEELLAEPLPDQVRLEAESRLAELEALTSEVTRLAGLPEGPEQIEALLVAEPSLHRSVVPLLERLLTERVLLRGPGERLVISTVPDGSNADVGSISIESLAGISGVQRLSTEYGDDVIRMDSRGAILPWGTGSIHRYTGSHELPGDYEIEGLGGAGQRLTFLVVDDVGYVYLRGQGIVFAPDGTATALPAGR